MGNDDSFFFSLEIRNAFDRKEAEKKRKKTVGKDTVAGEAIFFLLGL